MKILFDGLRKFRSEVFDEHKPLFEELSKGQAPHTLMIACSDSRIDPNLVTQTSPGELFVVRNAGNIIPAYGSSRGGEEAAIEYAIEALKVQHIVVCGHSQCGAMAALHKPESVKHLPAVARWLEHAESTKRRCEAIGKTDALTTIEENVLVQVENLKSHPAVSAALRKGQLTIYGWVYHFDRGEVTIYDPVRKHFVPTLEIKDRADHNMEKLAI